MPIKVGQVEQALQVEPSRQVEQADGTFKFTLAGKIEEQMLQERLNMLMDDITLQGKKIAKHMDVRDMKRYRELIKQFMNEIVSRSHRKIKQIALYIYSYSIVCETVQGTVTTGTYHHTITAALCLDNIGHFTGILRGANYYSPPRFDQYIYNFNQMLFHFGFTRIWVYQ